jgi:flagellar biosynthesis anti-sigma factor FlgM
MIKATTTPLQPSPYALPPQSKSASQPVASAHNAGAVASDPVQLSISSLGLGLAIASVGLETTKVQELRSQISNGSYSINPNQIAKSMLNTTA